MTLLEPGDRVPNLRWPTADGRELDLYEFAPGRPVTIIWPDEAPDDPIADDTLVVLPAEAATASQSPERVWIDDGRLQEMLGIEDVTKLEIDRNNRVVTTSATTPPPPPVLIIPDVLSPALLSEVLTLATEAPWIASGMPTTAGELVPDADAKLRTDHVVGEPLASAIAAEIHRRILPEVDLAFGFSAQRFEGIKLVRYEIGGHFHAHRDNGAPAVAHRRFAVTINLDRDYEGGGLRFLEFDHTPVVPPPGGAVVFSCSLQHQVVPVSAGTRHALITFLS